MVGVYRHPPGGDGPAAPASPTAPSSTAPVQGAPTGSSSAPGPGDLPVRRLVRAEQGRVVAGVAEGVGEYLRTDARAVRVLFVLATIFGGVGVLAYAVAWAVLPTASAVDAPAERLLRWFTGAPTAFQVVLVLTVALVAGGSVTSGRPGAGWGAVLIAVGFLLLRVDTRSQQQAGGPAPPPAAGPPPRAVPAAPAVTAAPVAPATWAAPQWPVAPVPSPSATAVELRPGAGTYGSYGLAPGPPVRAPSPPAPRRPPHPPSPLGRVTLAAALLLLVALTVADRIGVLAPGADGYLAVALGTLGLGLLVGARVGRARWLVPLGLLLVPPLAVATAGPAVPTVTQADVAALAEGVDRRRVTPTDRREVAAVYTVGFGELVLDLAKVDLVAEPTEVTVEVGAGALVVVVPDEARVTLEGGMEAGSATVFGVPLAAADVTDLSSVPFDRGPEDGGRLTLDLQVGAGVVEVRRASGGSGAP